MFIDGRTLRSNEQVAGKVCIVGAGVAGITLARELGKRLPNIILLESGGLASDARTQALYKGSSIGHPHYTTDTDRARYFGGTSNLWAGQCRPLDPIDFENRSWVGGLGWPFSRRTLDPYYEHCRSLLDLGDASFENDEQLARQLKLPRLKLNEDRLKTSVFHQSPPTRFGTKYRDELKNSDAVTVILHANALHFNHSENGTRIKSISATVLDGPSFQVEAEIFILATGGMENPRLMLLSEQANSEPFKWNSHLIGRYFMDHLILRPAAEASLSQNNWDFGLYRKPHSTENGLVFMVMAATRSIMEKEKLPNFRMNILDSRLQHFHDNIGVVTDVIDSFIREHHASTTEPPTTGYGVLAMHLGIEQVPNINSRVTLGKGLDELGQNQIELDWKVSNEDLRTAYRATKLVGLEFGRLGLGRIYSEMIALKDQWPNKLKGGYHHSGTTRMAENAEKGVVDANCKVHGVNNLFIAGSSVFPTIGYANPTLTIAALAVRLSDHILTNYDALTT